MMITTARRSRSAIAAVAFVAFVAFVARAGGTHAATGDPAAPPLRTGFEPKLYAGAGGVLESATLSVGQRRPSFGIHALLSYRIAMPIDLGLHVFHQWQDVAGLPAGASAYSSAAGGGVLARVHPLSFFFDAPFFDPSIGIGTDFFVYERQETRF